MYRTKKVRSASQRRLLYVCSVVLAMVGCGTGDNGDTGRSSATVELGAQGGVVNLENGLTLEVPQGALVGRTLVTLRETQLDGYSDIQIEPSELALTAPVLLGWVDDGEDLLESDANEPLSVERAGGRAHAGLRHFGHFRHFRHWGHCGKDAGADGGCSGRAHDGDGGFDHDWHSDGGAHGDDGDQHGDGGEGHGEHDAGVHADGGSSSRDDCDDDDDDDGGHHHHHHHHHGAHSPWAHSPWAHFPWAHFPWTHHHGDGHCDGHSDGGHSAGGHSDGGHADGGAQNPWAHFPWAHHHGDGHCGGHGDGGILRDGGVSEDAGVPPGP